MEQDEKCNQSSIPKQPMNYNINNIISQKKLSTIVLDLDNTLISSSEKVIDGIDYSFFIHEPYYDNYFGRLRPYLYDFLRLLPHYFDQIIVWSAGREKYVDNICYFIFSRAGYVPNLILSRKDCVEFTSDKGKKYRKPLQKIFTEYYANPEKTYLLDDSKTSMEQNSESNCILVKPYFGHHTDTYLKDVSIPWLQTLNWESIKG
jgi:TFIIF-interacting CTD phosphatase-like protein